jgi:hypothetical protein
MSGGGGADTFVIGAAHSRNTSLDKISDYTAGTDILDLEIIPTSLAATTGGDFSTASNVNSTGVTSSSLKTDIATAITAQRAVSTNYWKQTGDTIVFKLLGSSVAGDDVTYVVQHQAGGSSNIYVETRDTVVALVGTSTAPTTLADFA